MTYQAVFERADDGSIWAYVPDLPGCTSSGATLQEAERNIREAVELWIDIARERGTPIPPATTIAAAAIEVAAA